MITAGDVIQLVSEIIVASVKCHLEYELRQSQKERDCQIAGKVSPE
jgi:hypothetical protein